MRLPLEIAEAVGIAAQKWAESTSDLPLTITKKDGGAVLAQALPRQRYNKGQFARELGMGRNTFRKLEERFGITPAATDGCYDRETVEDVKRWLRNEEDVDQARLNRRFPDRR